MRGWRAEGPCERLLAEAAELDSEEMILERRLNSIFTLILLFFASQLVTQDALPLFPSKQRERVGQTMFNC